MTKESKLWLKKQHIMEGLNVNSLFCREILMEVNVKCKNCNEKLYYDFAISNNEYKISKACNCGKCKLTIYPRKRLYVADGEYEDNSVSVIEDTNRFKKDWRM